MTAQATETDAATQARPRRAYPLGTAAEADEALAAIRRHVYAALESGLARRVTRQARAAVAAAVGGDARTTRAKVDLTGPLVAPVAVSTETGPLFDYGADVAAGETVTVATHPTWSATSTLRGDVSGDVATRRAGTLLEFDPADTVTVVAAGGAGQVAVEATAAVL